MTSMIAAVFFIVVSATIDGTAGEKSASIPLYDDDDNDVN